MQLKYKKKLNYLYCNTSFFRCRKCKCRSKWALFCQRWNVLHRFLCIL